MPGHGEIGGAELIAQERGVLAAMQARARVLKQPGISVADAATRLTEELKAQFPGWENPEFLADGIRRFYAEAP